MKTRISLAVFCVLAGSLFVGAAEIQDNLPSVSEGKAWRLVWHDEFDGKQLDGSKWDIPENRRRDGFWSRQAIDVDGQGHLVIRTFQENGRYLDGCVRTRGKFEHAYGYYVVRARFQQQPGHWTAFWLMGSGVSKVGDDGRDGTEIDIMENQCRWCVSGSTVHQAE